MSYFDLLKETLVALTSNITRTLLTMLGIVIGISSVIAMVSIGQGAQASITSSITSLGSNLVTVSPGAQQGPGFQPSAGRGSAKTLTQADADAIIESVTNIVAVSPEVSNRYQIAAKGTNTNTSVVGVTSVYPEVRNVSVEDGVFISDQHVRSMSKVAVLGPTTATDLFGESGPLGQQIRVNGIQFKVIGVTVAKGGSGFTNQDDMVYIPLSTAQKFLLGDSYVTSVNVKAESSESMTAIQEQISSLLLKRHNIDDAANADFSVMNQSDIVSTASTITSTFTALLAAVAGISLVVGGIGIMNMMLTTVTERTREIGLRKAVGATISDINRQFLMEAVVLTLLSGAVGIALGLGISYAFTYLQILQTSVTLSSILLAFGVSAIIGIVFGYYPARRASRMNPIDALRYE
jgi:putative ABC transport system permease protein